MNNFLEILFCVKSHVIRIFFSFHFFFFFNHSLYQDQVTGQQTRRTAQGPVSQQQISFIKKYISIPLSRTSHNDARLESKKNAFLVLLFSQRKSCFGKAKRCKKIFQVSLSSRVLSTGNLVPFSFVLILFVVMLTRNIFLHYFNAGKLIIATNFPVHRFSGFKILQILFFF